jgi:hypothetical protein
LCWCWRTCTGRMPPPGSWWGSVKRSFHNVRPGLG